MHSGNFILIKEPLKTEGTKAGTIIQHSVNPLYTSYVLPVDISSQFPLVIEIGINMGFSYMDKGKINVCFMVIKKNTDKASLEVLSPLLYQQALFYIDYLNEGRSLEDQNSWMPFRDYNRLTPGLRIIEFRPQRTFIVSHPLGISSFMNKPDLFGFLMDGLRYPLELILEGDYNVIEQKGASVISDLENE